MTTPAIRTARVYDPPSPRDGTRVLADRLWPRGIAKADAGFDEWCKDVAPSTELRKWYAHDPQRFEEFRDRYLAELTDPPAAAALAHLRTLAGSGPLTLLTATKELTLSHLSVLSEAITS